MRWRSQSTATGKGVKARRRCRNFGYVSKSLTPREREVIGLVTAGMMNKQIAGEMDISEITVKIHRGHVMRKMQARSLADLVRMAEALGVRRDRVR